jgi:spermidine/putrescine transport system substrate-binding protein
MAASPVSRRGFLRAAGLTGLGLGMPSLLSACGTPAAKQTAGSCVSKDLSASQKTLHFSNWPLYIDEKKVKQGGKKVTVYPSSRSSSRRAGSRSTTSPTSTTTTSSSGSCATSSPTASPPGATS